MLIAVIDPRVRVQRLRIFDLAYSDHPTVVRVRSRSTTLTPEEHLPFGMPNPVDLVMGFFKRRRGTKANAFEAFNVI